MTIADYRTGEIPRPSPEHVDRWVKQFEPACQLSILQEMDHVLRRNYISKQTTVNFMNVMFQTRKLVGDDPCTFWRDVMFLDIQERGASQKEMLTLFNNVLKNKCASTANECETEPNTFIYLDDAIFSGGHVYRDLAKWITNEAPENAKIYVIVMAIHSSSNFFTRKLEKKAREKNIKIDYWFSVELEDRKSCTDISDVLRPVSIPEVRAVQKYSSNLSHSPELRKPGKFGDLDMFSTESGRHVLEQEFLKAGVHIRQQCPHLHSTQRPLGSTLLNTLGFGSLVVTFRNCANNTPLALWAGTPWYPLFERKTNRVTSKEMDDSFGEE